MEVTKSAVTGAVSNGSAQAWLAVKHRLHGAVFGKEAVLGRSVPIHLGVKVVAIQFLCSRLGIVVGADGATESAAKIIELTVSLWASLKKLLCPQRLVLKVLKSRSMVLIGA